MITPAASPVQPKQRPAAPRLLGPEVLLMAPTTMAEADQLIEAVRGNRTIVINLSALPEAAGQRLVDYACGGMAAIDGQSHQLGHGVFLFTSGLTRVEAA
jgi:FtsZ-interacting cell division protein YlmF